MSDLSEKEESFEKPKGIIVKIVETFLTGPLSIILILTAVVLGMMAVFMTPREEEPQIVVPMVDVSVDFPGHSPEEVEQLVTIPLERILWQIEGVEHVYSMSRRDSAMVTVRFYVGEDRERSMVKLRDKIGESLHLVHPDVTNWKVDPVEIDDVPIVSLTLFSPEMNAHELRRVAEEMKYRLDSLKNISLSQIFGGYEREILIEPDIEDMAARDISLSDIKNSLLRNNSVSIVGNILEDRKNMRMIVSPPLQNLKDLQRTVIKTSAGGLVYLEDIAKVKDGPTEMDNHYTRVGFGPASRLSDKIKSGEYPSVTLAFSKKKGTNAVDVAENVIKSAEEIKDEVAPAALKMIVSRDYGKTADKKVNDLLSSMVFAVLTVVTLLMLTLGWREAVVVGVAVPVSFALALFTNYLAGFTINRVTLFALILSLGLVVDDPITNVDNIQRHIKMGIFEPFRATLLAVHEVIPPVIMSTLAIIISFTPMFFITGMMGPYMGPMAINVPLTVSFSTLCALTFVPWMSYKLLRKTSPKYSSVPKKKNEGNSDGTPKWIRNFYRIMMSPFLKKRNAYILITAVLLMTAGAAALMFFEVPLKMLPFDNKNEFQLILEMPEGTTLEETDKVCNELEKIISRENEVVDYETYVGLNSPIDFNGLVRHYGMRRMPHQADIRINLAKKTERKSKSHSIVLRIMDKLTEKAAEYGGVLSVVEVPPGPPVLSSFAVEIRGDAEHTHDELLEGAEQLVNIFQEVDSKHIKQIDIQDEAQHDRINFRVDREKAAEHGLSVSEITSAVSDALGDTIVGSVHDPRERNPLFINLRLPYKDRNSIERLSQLWIKLPGSRNKLVQLSELGDFLIEKEEQSIYHKNLDRVVFVNAETVGRPPGEIIMEILFNEWDKPFLSLFEAASGGEWRHTLPNGTNAEWNGEGEWQITVRVFRDLGIAFGVAMLGILMLLIIQTGGFVIPLIIMTSIPLTIIGIAPGFYLLNLIVGDKVGGYDDPVFFTATGMIGMIALGGIVIRNSIVLIEFIQGAEKKGDDLQEAILESGAVRFRPIVLTALTTMLGAWPITLDPVFSGLAWALIFGLIASTFFTLLIVPTIYNLVYSGRESKQKNINQ